MLKSTPIKCFLFASQLFTLGFLVFFPPSALGEELRIDAPAVHYDQDKKFYRYEDARITFGTLVLDASLVEISLEKNHLTASGLVQFHDGNFRGSAERLELEIKSGKAEMWAVKLLDKKTGFYLNAEKVLRVGPGRIIAEKCSLTTCSPEKGGWNFYTSKLDYRTDNFATSTNTVLKIGPVPVFWFPYMAWPTVKKRQSGFLTPSFSRESSTEERLDLGYRTRIPFFWALNVNQDLSLDPEIISDRGTALHLEYRYAFAEGQTGKVKWFGINEKETRNRDQETTFPNSTERKAHSTRQTLSWGNNQPLFGKDRLILTVEGASDGQVVREYQRQELHRPYRSFLASYSLQGTSGGLALSTAHTSDFQWESVYATQIDDTNGMYRPRLRPKLEYTIGGRFFDAFPLGLEINGKLMEFDTTVGISGKLAETRAVLSLPLALGGSAELRPSVSRRFVEYQSLVEREKNALETELAAEKFVQNGYQLELRANLARTYVKEGNALKHRITPRLILAGLDDVPQPMSQDDDPVSPDAQVLYPSFATKTATFRLDNLWLKSGRDGAPASPYAILNLIQRYNLLRGDENFEYLGPKVVNQETDPGEPVLPFILEGSLFTPGFSVSTFLRYHHQDQDLSEIRLSLKGTVGTRNSLGVTYHQNDKEYRTEDNKLFPETSRISFLGAGKISEPVRFGFKANLNLNTKINTQINRRMEAGGLFVEYKPDCFAIRATYSETVSLSSSGATSYILDRKLVFSFDLGGILTAESTSRLSGSE